MDERVEQYIANLQKRLPLPKFGEPEEEIVLSDQEIKQLLLDKNRFLVDKGLFDKVYSPYETSSPEYPKVEYSTAKGRYLYYKYQPVEMTDETYLQIRMLHKKIAKSRQVKQEQVSNDIEKKYSSIATLMYIFAAIVLIFGVIFSIICFGVDVFTAIVCLVAVLIQGVVYIYLGNVFNDMDDVRQEIAELTKEIDSLKSEIRNIQDNIK